MKMSSIASLSGANYTFFCIQWAYLRVQFLAYRSGNLSTGHPNMPVSIPKVSAGKHSLSLSPELSLLAPFHTSVRARSPFFSLVHRALPSFIEIFFISSPHLANIWSHTGLVQRFWESAFFKKNYMYCKETCKIKPKMMHAVHDIFVN